MIDFRTGELIDEVLVATGGEFPERFPVLDSHSRETTSDVVGSATSPRREGNQWFATLTLAADDPRADAILSKVRDGHLDSVSIGYVIQDWKMIPRGDSAQIDGRTFTAGRKPLRVVTAWRVHEVSVVAIPADSAAKIRSAPLNQNRKGSSMTRMSTPLPARSSSLGHPPSLGALESALLLRMGVSDPSRVRVSHYGQEYQRMTPSVQTEQDAEQGRELHTQPLLRIVQLAAELDGIRFSSQSSGAVLHQLHGHYVNRAAMSGGALSALFTNVFGALFVDGFDSVFDVTEGWVSVAENPTLKQTPRVRPEQLPGGVLKQRSAGATAIHVAPQAVSEVTQLGDGFAAKFVIDEVDIINNSFGNSQQISPRMLGQAAARLRPLRVLAELLKNPLMRDEVPLFHADHGNLLTSATLSGEKIQEARAAMSKQTEGGAPLHLRGNFLIVPEALEREAAKLAREVELMDSRSTAPPVVRSEARLDTGFADPVASGQTFPGSAANWFLAADGGPHSIEVQYLTGTGGQPRIRSGFLEHGQFGMWFDIEHFVSAKALDWRGLVKCEA